MQTVPQLTPPAPAPVGSMAPTRVLVVDDSATIRGLITRTLEAASDISVVASASNGAIAVTALKQHAPDVVILDIEMPVLDGLGALPLLLAADPKVRVIMVSTLTLRNAEISLRALSLGAADYIAKPSSAREISASDDFRRELVDKVKALGGARRRALPPEGSGRMPAAAAAEPARNAASPRSITLRPPSPIAPAVIAIGSSTGGPQALAELLSRLDSHIEHPILITQHMPATFTVILAAHLGRVSGRICSEALEGEPVLPGHIYVAPGGFHMLVVSKDGRAVVQIVDGPRENFCKPAVDPMLRSAVSVYGGAVLAAILTGMGSDGLQGCGAVVAKGGTVIAQDETSSVVWGMPGAVACAGLCSAVLPVADIAALINRIARPR